MSTKAFKYRQVYETLKESIDYQNADIVPLQVGEETTFEVEGMTVEIELALIPEESKVLFSAKSILYNEFEEGEYFNIGFSIEDSVTQKYKTNYRTLAKILGIVVKSTVLWIQQNNPKVVIIVPKGKDKSETEKKLNIYASILQANEPVLDQLGYYWDTGRFGTYRGIYIASRDF